MMINIQKRINQMSKLINLISSQKRKTNKMLKMNKITYEEEKAALILGITAIFTVWWILK